MIPIDKCVSVETAQRLQDAGFLHEVEKFWTIPDGKWDKKFMEVNPGYTEEDMRPTKPQLMIDPYFYGVYGTPVKMAAAPDAQELGALLPREFILAYNNGRPRMTKHRLVIRRMERTNEWEVNYINNHSRQSTWLEYRHANLAEAMAQAWIYLKTNKLIS